MATDKDGKLTYQMKSPGEAWMDHANNQMGAGNVTPAWADRTPSNDALQKQFTDLNKKVDSMSQTQGQDVNQDKGAGVSQFDKWRQEYREKQNNPEKSQAKEKDHGISR